MQRLLNALPDERYRYQMAQLTGNELRLAFLAKCPMNPIPTMQTYLVYGLHSGAVKQSSRVSLGYV